MGRLVCSGWRGIDPGTVYGHVLFADDRHRYRSRFGRAARRDAAQDPNVNLDIGQSVAVAHWVDGAARVMYRGALWDVELIAGSDTQAGHYTIRAVRGSRLIVG